MAVADVVFTGGSVFSAGDESSSPADVAIAGGRIIAIGSPEAVAETIGPDTRMIDTARRLIVSGFQDAHVHPIIAGLELLRCDLSTATSADECLQMISTYAHTHPDEPWITGGGWSMGYFEGGTPTAAALDAVVSDRPVIIVNRDHHGAWVNSRALEIAGITAETPDPADGRIERLADGSPSGTLHEGAMALVQQHQPAVDADLAYQSLLRAQDELLRFGITSWQDAMVGDAFGVSDILAVYLRAQSEGTLKVRVTAALWWERDRGLEQVEEMAARRAEISALGTPERLRADTVKIMVDGVAENFTAAMSTPYLDGHGHPTGNSGHSFLDPAVLSDTVVALDAAEFQVHFHALGDRAVTEALDALEAAAAANAPHERRHHLAHLQVVGEADVARFAELGVTANLQALWAAHEDQLDELTIPFLDPALVERHYPFGDLERAGVRLAAGSDWPVTSPDPVAAIHVAVGRVAHGSTAEPLGPEQSLSLASALTAYTAGSAYVNGREDSTGRLAVGLLADLVVLDRDPFALPSEAIAETQVVSTWIDGIPVYQRASTD
ncbi:amidohydrolase [uncultured Microbacterium sp.]|uniref:amidohydrolase n=1 Tax=uncultured Microbacterium sp. TaxID=191216 RepID=UPI0035C9C7E0